MYSKAQVLKESITNYNMDKNYPILLSVQDIASKYNISRYNVWNWHRRNSAFPQPQQYVNNGRTPLFCESEIEKFLKSTNS